MRKKHTGTVKVMPSGLVRVQVQVRKRRITAYGKTEAEARAKVEERLNRLGQQDDAQAVAEVFAQWQASGAEALHLAPTTFDQYRYLLSKHVVPFIGKVRMEFVSRDDVHDLLKTMPGSASSKRSTYAALVHLFEYARQRRIVGANVVREVPRPKSRKGNRSVITQAEALRILAAAKGHRLEVAVWLGLGAGLRRGEMLGLKWSDVDLDAGYMHIEGNVTRSSAGLRRGDTKNRRLRYVSLSPEVSAALRAHRKAQAVERLAAGNLWVASDHVIATSIGGVVEPRALNRVWASWARTARVEDKGTHVGRHFAATTLLASGRASVADIAEMLGHDAAVLLNTYAKPVQQGQRAAIAVLGAALSESV